MFQTCSGFDQFFARWRLDSLSQCCREGNFTVLLFWENKLLPMDTIIPAGLLPTEGEVPTALRLLHEGWIHREHYQERQWSAL